LRIFLRRRRVFGPPFARGIDPLLSFALYAAAYR
jgi:hypothetical protein